MTDMTKPDLSREDALRALADRIERADCAPMRIDPVAASAIRALLDAKEAAERERGAWRSCRDEAVRCLKNTTAELDQALSALTEARASAPAAWEAGRDAAAKEAEATLAYGKAFAIPACIRALTNPDPSAAEALRRDRERVWAEGYKSGLMSFGPAGTNPYADKEDAHG